MLIADYWIVRRRELRLEDLYLTDGVYRGWNWRAIGATALGCALAWSGLVIPALKPLYDYAWFVGFFAAGPRISRCASARRARECRDVVSRAKRLDRSVSVDCSPMDLRQLEILQAIAETGSFTACGRKLNVSQSAISRQILLLEEELGEPLFLRVGRQVRMTPAAESLVQLGQRVFQDVRETVGAITDRTRALRGTLRLAGGMTVCLYVFPPLLKHLKRVHPQLDVRLTVATAARSVEEIRAGRSTPGC